MMRLPLPKYTFKNALDKCVLGIERNENLKRKLVAGADELLQKETEYINAATAGLLYGVLPVDISLNPDPTVVSELLRSDLRKTYETYFRPEEKPAREIYDYIYNLANGDCPYCGGIGTPRNLDHYLPAAHFPQFSVMPRNLVPACRDCNMDGIPDGYASRPEDQILHPYVDHDRFFTEQWISATYYGGNIGKPAYIEYYPNPPDMWQEVDKLRAHKHFNEFGLSKRYSIKAASNLRTPIAQIKKMRESGQSEDGIINILLKPGVEAAPFVNHWQRGMYQALIEVLSSNDKFEFS